MARTERKKKAIKSLLEAELSKLLITINPQVKKDKVRKSVRKASKYLYKSTKLGEKQRTDESPVEAVPGDIAQ